MSLFKKKNLSPPKRVCLCLKEAREARGISLDYLAKKTKISKDFLQALEDCRFKDLPNAEVYQKNFIKRYSEVLGVDPEPFLGQYRIEESCKKKAIHPNQGIRINYLYNLPNFLRYGLSTILLLSLFIYLGLQVKNIIEPPKLIIYSPSHGYVTEETSVLLQGETDKEAVVSLNGKEVGTDEKNNFEELVNLSPGVNTLTIEARKKYGKITKDVRHVILKIKEN
ncbi:helix-turn-helix domain-containing protein [Patescibacteria group bacterium]|nr:helix-turn-helix domain-containing protein [Patescibacteria group bacterium]